MGVRGFKMFCQSEGVRIFSTRFVCVCGGGGGGADSAPNLP